MLIVLILLRGPSAFGISQVLVQPQPLKDTAARVRRLPQALKETVAREYSHRLLKEALQETGSLPIKERVDERELMQRAY